MRVQFVVVLVWAACLLLACQLQVDGSLVSDRLSRRVVVNSSLQPTAEHVLSGQTTHMLTVTPKELAEDVVAAQLAVRAAEASGNKQQILSAQARLAEAILQQKLDKDEKVVVAYAAMEKARVAHPNVQQTEELHKATKHWSLVRYSRLAELRNQAAADATKVAVAAAAAANANAAAAKPAPQAKPTRPMRNRDTADVHPTPSAKPVGASAAAAAGAGAGAAAAAAASASQQQPIAGSNMPAGAILYASGSAGVVSEREKQARVLEKQYAANFLNKIEPGITAQLKEIETRIRADIKRQGVVNENGIWADMAVSLAQAPIIAGTSIPTAISKISQASHTAAEQSNNGAGAGAIAGQFLKSTAKPLIGLGVQAASMGTSSGAEQVAIDFGMNAAQAVGGKIVSAVASKAAAAAAAAAAPPKPHSK